MKLCYSSASELEKLERQRVLNIFEEESDEDDFLGFPSPSPGSNEKESGKQQRKSAVRLVQVQCPHPVEYKVWTLSGTLELRRDRQSTEPSAPAGRLPVCVR
ncbi:hypothetical protein ABVT39_005487 [Epinephelus coioides]